MLNTLALIAICGHELVTPFGLLRDVFVVVAGVEMDVFIPHLHGLLDRDVQEIAVVRTQQVRAGIIVKISFEPVPSFEIEVIGRLVEQQQIGTLQQEFREREAHLPAAGEFFGTARPILFAEAQAVEHGAGLRLNCIAVAIAKLAIDMMRAIRCPRPFRIVRIEIRHFVMQLFELLFHRAKIVEHRHRLLKHCAAGKREAILRKIAEGHPLGEGNRPVVERFLAAQDFQQRGFTGAVAADEARALARR